MDMVEQSVRMQVRHCNHCDYSCSADSQRGADIHRVTIGANEDSETGHDPELANQQERRQPPSMSRLLRVC
jgi:hypothetical protein